MHKRYRFVGIIIAFLVIILAVLFSINKALYEADYLVAGVWLILATQLIFLTIKTDDLLTDD